MNSKKWERAVVHLECIVDSEDSIAQHEILHRLQLNLNQERITESEFHSALAAIEDRRTPIRDFGTAIFLLHENRRYLLTAKHVVWDELSATRVMERDAEWHKSHPPDMQEDAAAYAKKRAQDTIFQKIYRGLSIDEIKGESKLAFPLMPYLSHLQIGPTDSFAWSTPASHLDLAVISLDRINTGFAEDLLKSGYTPITVADLASEPVSEGEDVYAIGFPINSHQSPIPVEPSFQNLVASTFALPNSVTGKVVMSKQELTYFWAVMPINYGNSGGPVIARDKLVGIVSRRRSLTPEILASNSNFNESDTVGRVTHIRHILPLLRLQQLKDKFEIAKAWRNFEFIQKCRLAGWDQEMYESLEFMEKWAAGEL
ncbi:serine protease [Hymenobacter sp. GOD-10R]|uniref:serine protease n=1 Tax=Hymenobacter sp. GOD-10R TaxID=3093922 RepID=UPI002D7833F1|nr:serine protease [Hymenobacter sp. GOD-10R]WRQ31821.1 serine protease [Hymenobacter sp. GOD-10R]